MDAAEIQLALQKLNVLGRVLYVAAHPDDENTNLISYWANGSLFDSAYLSLTRGDGGQNLIGAELREQLGLIRTQELLAARRLDHGQQFFSRANDFGYSKSPEETLRIWDREKILADTVWVIRKFRPDVIVTRFMTEDSPTHGHHTSSARLAVEAFTAAADPARFPEQLRYVQPWKATRIVWNTSRFFFTTRNIPFDPSAYLGLDVGGYQPLLGKSYPEIASASRSQHKSQGFSVPTERGARTEYFKLLEGAPATKEPFEAIDTTWARVPKATGMAAKIQAVIAAYSPANPAASAPGLLEVRRALAPLADNNWASQKRNEVDGLIAACLGLHLEAATEKASARPGENLALQAEVINRSTVPVRFLSMRFPVTDETIAVDTDLVAGQLLAKKATAKLPASMPLTQAYWLRQPGTVGTFAVEDQALIGLPENPPAFPVEVTLGIGGEKITYTLEASYRSVDPAEGETIVPLIVAPPVFVEFPKHVFVFSEAKARSFDVRVVASAESFDGEIALEAPAGWKVEPASAKVQIRGAEKEAILLFKIVPPSASSEGMLHASITPAGGTKSPAHSRQRIRYGHIPTQTLIPVAEAKLTRVEMGNNARLIGYLPGAGDAIPESLSEIGAEVKVLGPADMKAASLARYDAVILGVRAYNVQERLDVWSPELIAYAKSGGVVIAQYNTTPTPKAENFPYPLKIGRDRVTDEDAEMRILAPTHPVMTTPNKIGAADFAGWVQERGLYFPNEWDPGWTPILSSNDPKEKPLDGGLLVAKVGDGYFVYTGYSFFRQLPAGVPGAYRLFANMISLGGAKRAAPLP